MRKKYGTRGTAAEKTIKSIRRATRKQYSAEEKIRIVLCPSSYKLEQYAALYESVYGSVEKTEDLIPFMLDGFIRSDAGFRKARKEKEAILHRQLTNNDDRQ